MQASRIPVLRERCPNLEAGGRQKLLTSVKAERGREAGRWKEVRVKGEEGGSVIGDLGEQLERSRRENRVSGTNHQVATLTHSYVICHAPPGGRSRPICSF